MVAFEDLNPQAPVHLLIIPKKLIPRVSEMSAADEIVVGHLFLVANLLAKKLQLADGMELHESISRATATAGGAVVFAGFTVVIALCSLAFAGYFVSRNLRPDVERPFRLPTVAKWGALGVFVIWTAIYFFGGWNSPKIILNDPKQGPGLYLLGLLIVALYAPLYWWRAWQDRKLAAAGRAPKYGAPLTAPVKVTASAVPGDMAGADGQDNPVAVADPGSEPDPAGE